MLRGYEGKLNIFGTITSEGSLIYVCHDKSSPEHRRDDLTVDILIKLLKKGEEPIKLPLNIMKSFLFGFKQGTKSWNLFFVQPVIEDSGAH